MADDDDPKKTRAYKKQNTENESAESDNVGHALRILSGQFGTLLDEIEAERATEARERHKERSGQRIIAGIGTIIAFFTLAVLVKTCSVYNAINRTEITQATIMATQATIMDRQRQISSDVASAAKDANKLSELGLVAEVGIEKASTCDAAGNAVLTFANTGQTKARNVEISAKFYGTNTSVTPNFDPFTDINALNRAIIQNGIDGYENMRRQRLALIKNPSPEVVANEKRRLNEDIDELERTFKNSMQQDIDQQRLFLPPSYIQEIPAGDTADYSVSIGKQLVVPGTTAFIYGIYSYDDELGKPHNNNRFCWRYVLGHPSSCLTFQPVAGEAKKK